MAMDDAITLARPYAQAAYRQAERESAVDPWSEGMELLAAVTEDPELAKLLADPRVPADRVTDLVLDVCRDGLSPTMANFVRVLGEGRRLGLGPEIARLFEAERSRRAGRSAVEIVSAYELDPPQVELLAQAIGRRLGREITLETAVDDSLIGGVVIRVGDSVIDASLAGRLRELAQDLV